jgi:hypothetical protein
MVPRLCQGSTGVFKLGCLVLCADSFNLVLGDTTSSTLPATNLFMFLNSTASFYCGSRKRRNEWTQCLSSKIGAHKLKVEVKSVLRIGSAHNNVRTL